MTSKKDEEVPEFLARIPLTFRDYPGEVGSSEPVTVTSVLLPPAEAEHVSASKSAKPAGKETT